MKTLIAKEPISYGTSAADQRRYEPGETIACDDDAADALLTQDAATEVVVEAPKRSKKDA